MSAFLLALLVGSGTANAEPAFSVSAVSACNTCHVEPTDWANPEMKDRRCTLDCQGCHVSPSGGGMRTSSGRFYGKEELPLFGRRPSSDAAPRPNAGQSGYQMLIGFHGWQPGSTPAQTVADRYGKIDPNPTLDGGGDVRAMGYFPLGESEEYPAFFPMEVELYGAWRPSEHVVVYADLGLDSTRANLNFLPTSPDGTSPLAALEYLRLRELFVKIDRLPYQGYVLVGRFAPPFGWRIPDHTSFVRRDLGFDQNRQVYGVQAGINPNYPYANVALFWQGIEAWPGDDQQPGYGAAATAGVRELAWQAGGSIQALRFLDKTTQITLGPTWAVNANPLSYIGELDFRHDGGADPTNGLFALHELRWHATRGVHVQAKFDWEDTDLRYVDDHRNRYSLGVLVHPFTSTELNVQYRRTYVGGSVFTLGGALQAQELLLQVHGFL